MFMTDISISSVKIGLFVCWQITNVCVFAPSPPSPRLSCAAGYDVRARRAWMEDLSYKRGKEGNFQISASFQDTRLSAASMTSIILILNGSNGCSDLFHPCFCSDPFCPHGKYCYLDTDNEPGSLRKLPLYPTIFLYQFLSCLSP